MLEEKQSNVCVCCTVCSQCNIELALLLDSSAKSIANAWTQIKEFAVSVIAGYTINSNCVRAAITRYNDALAISSTLTSYNDRNSLQQHIRGLSLLNGGSSLGTALRELRINVFSSTYARSVATLIAVIVTDNLQPSWWITNEANLAKNQGITIIAVGITRQGRVDTITLYAVATRSGFTIYATTVSDYTQLSGVVSSVTTQWGCPVSTTTPATTPAPIPSNACSFMSI